MDAARWDKLEVLFEQAKALPAAQRKAFLDRSCDDDRALRSELESLLAVEQQADVYLGDLAHPIHQYLRLVEAPEESPFPEEDGLVGTVVSHYRILERLSEGGMGVVYRAEDSRLPRIVALKFLPPEWRQNNAARQRFKHEALAASALDHPNICTIYEIDETPEGQLFIAMACYEGETVKEKIARGPLPVSEALDLAAQAAGGLAKAHERGIIHRDVKPANLMVTPEGIVKILDFGLAKMADVTLTQSGARMGTLAYMSPEQVRGQTVDACADIWSLGVVLYEMLAGRRPFEGGHEQTILSAILNDPPIPIETVRSGLPVGLADVLNRCLQKNPDERWASASEVRSDLVQLASGRNDAGLYAARPVERYERRISRPVWLMSAAASLLMLIGLVSFNWKPVGRWLGVVNMPSAKHLAVLPFTNIGNDPANQMFADGLVETLTSKLAQMEQFDSSLWIVPTSEVRRYNPGSPSEARQAFEVNLVVTGSVQRNAERVRLILNLVDARTLRQLNSRTIDHEISDLSNLQDEAVFALTILLEMETQPKAREVLTAGGTTIPEAYDYYVQGQGYLQRYEDLENLDLAVQLFQRAVTADAQYALAYSGMAEAYWRKYLGTGDTQWVEPAEEYAQRALSLNDLLAPVHVTLGLILTGKGQHEEAVRQFNQALSLDERSDAAYRGLAMAYESQGKLVEAESTYKRAIYLKKDYWGGYSDLGFFYYRQSRFEEAIRMFREVLNLTPDNYLAYSYLGGLYYYLDQYAEAEKMLKYSIERKPTYNAYTNLATLYYYQQNFSAAALAYEEALKLESHDHRVWGYLANLYYWTPGQRDDAKETYKQAIERAEAQRTVNPNNMDLLIHLAGYYAMVSEKDTASKIVKQVVSMKPTDNNVWVRIGYTFEQLGDRDNALVWIIKALENGYSLADIEREPGLRELCSDKRFRQFLATGPSENQPQDF